MFNRKGFTLIELLIVVVIIGILAAIAIPKFATTKDKAKLASIKTDLRNLMTAQEAYFSDYSTYAANVARDHGRAVQLQLLVRQHAAGRGWRRERLVRDRDERLHLERQHEQLHRAGGCGCRLDAGWHDPLPVN